MAENKENTNVNNGNQGVNNNTNVNQNVNNPPANNQQPNEYAGVKELFGDYTINKDTFTQEELQNILEGSERLNEEKNNEIHRTFVEFTNQQSIIREQQKKADEERRLQNLKNQAYERYLKSGKAFPGGFNYEQFIQQEKRESEAKLKAQRERIQKKKDEEAKQKGA